MPLSNPTPPANGSETDQVIPLLNSVKVKTNKRGRPRKPLKVLAADKGYDSKDKRTALRRRSAAMAQAGLEDKEEQGQTH